MEKENFDIFGIVSHIVSDKNSDIQNFKFNSKKHKKTASFIVYNDPQNLAELDSIKSVKVKLILNMYEQLPSIIKFGKYRFTIDNYQAKRLYFSIVNRMYRDLNNSKTDIIADSIIKKINNSINNLKSLSMSHPLGNIAEVGLDEQMNVAREPMDEEPMGETMEPMDEKPMDETMDYAIESNG